MKVKMIFFDLDGTLLDHKTSEFLSIGGFYEEYKNYFSITKDEFYSLWTQISDKYFKRYLNNELTFGQQRR